MTGPTELRFMVFAALLTVGCQPAEGYPDRGTPPAACHSHYEYRAGYLADVDGDGFGICQLDCDDTDPAAHPAAEEVPGNGVDENCDGSDAPPLGLADGAPTFRGTTEAPDLYAAGGDVTGDGLADLALTRRGPGVWWTEIHPGPVDPEASPITITLPAEWQGRYAPGPRIPGDIDGDGADDLIFVLGAFGVEESYLCRVPTPLSDDVVLGPTMCELLTELGLDEVSRLEMVGDLNGDGAPDLALHLRGWEGPVLQIAPGGAAWTGFDASFASLAAPIPMVPAVIEGAADLTGDGIADLVVGLPRDDEAGEAAGKVLVYTGPVEGDLTLDDAFATYLAEAEWDLAGSRLSTASDLDSDGAPDLIVTSPGAGDDESHRGRVYVLPDIDPGAHLLGDVPLQITGALRAGRLGSSLVDLGDVDSDGHDDLLLGGYANTTGPIDGGVHLVLGGWSGALTSAEAAAVVTTPEAFDSFGGVLGLGDVDGDGLQDALGFAGRSHRSGGHVTSAWLLRGAQWTP